MTTPTKPNAIATVKPSAINLMASRMSVEPAKLYSTLKATVAQSWLAAGRITIRRNIPVKFGLPHI